MSCGTRPECRLGVRDLFVDSDFCSYSSVFDDAESKLRVLDLVNDRPSDSSFQFDAIDASDIELDGIRGCEIELIGDAILEDGGLGDGGLGVCKPDVDDDEDGIE